MSKLKKVNLVLSLTLIFLSAAVYFFWSQDCFQYDCSVAVDFGLLMPLFSSTLAIGLIIFPFIFLPTHYFKAWLIKIFSWFSLIAFLAIVDTEPMGGSWFPGPDRYQVAIGFGVLLAVITLIFLCLHFWSTKRNKEKTK